MKTKGYINITGSNYAAGINWQHTVPVTKFWKKYSRNGLNFYLVSRNYYLDMKQQKIRYQNTGKAYCDNASYYMLFTVYVEIAPCVYAYAGNVTNEYYAIDHKLETIAEKHSDLDQDKKTAFLNSLIEV